MSEEAPHPSVAAEKSFTFAVRIVQLCRFLRKKRVESELLSQLLRAGTSITANVSEAEYAYSRADFFYKIRIALKECAETHTWLKLLHATASLTDAEYASINQDCVELLKILGSICRTAQKNEGVAASCSGA